MHDLERLKTLLKEQGGYRVAVNGNRAMVCCPFHADPTPSCSLNFDPDSTYVGSYYCFGCGAHGSWAKFARQAAHVHGWSLPETALEHARLLVSLKPLEPLVIMRQAETIDQWLLQNYPVSIRWDKLKNPPGWRGFSASTMIMVDTWMVQSYNPKDQQKALMPFFPVTINGYPYGGVRADFFDKLYLNTKTADSNSRGWRSTHGLLFYDVARKMLDLQNPFVCLCEGVRDALRLIEAGVPAVAMLGTQGWSKEKSLLLIDLVSTLYAVGSIFLVFDTDVAGQQATLHVKASLQADGVSVVAVGLPSPNGQKVDVFDLPPHYLQELVDLVSAEAARRVLNFGLLDG